ncbi:MAG: serine/threonine-protein kinase [Pseudomonadota bacterium]
MSTTADPDTVDSVTDELPIGTHLLDGEFEILCKLGMGGFGITYLAMDSILNRRVVIKECFPDVCCLRDGRSVVVRQNEAGEKFPSVLKMFMREACTAAQIRHPNVVGVHRVFEDNSTAYMVLELIEGRDLFDLIEDEDDNLTPVEVHEILTKLLDAIAIVHSQGILHRDISPDNIVLDRWNSPILIDFGAARNTTPTPSGGAYKSAFLTVKDGYSPHEFYVAGAKQMPSSDLYALAATFYHLISGDPPPDSQARLAAAASKEPDPCEPLAGRFEAYDMAFLQAIDKAMSFAPRDRFETAQEWGEVIAPTSTTVLRAKSASDPNLERRLAKLVKETNKQVLSYTEQKAEATRKAQVTQAQTSEPEIPDWVKEFNAETLELARANARKGRRGVRGTPRGQTKIAGEATSGGGQPTRPETGAPKAASRNPIPKTTMHGNAPQGQQDGDGPPAKPSSRPPTRLLSSEPPRRNPKTQR